MSRPTARLNDKTFGTCFHPVHVPPLVTGGRIITASSDIVVNGRPLARHGDKVRADCGHISEIITDTGRNKPNADKGTARLFDKVGNGPYIAKIVTASPNLNQSNS